MKAWSLTVSSQNNPLHVSLFPQDQRDALEFSFLLSSCLDIFEARMPQKTVDQDFGLLQAIDERLAMYGWLTNTGVKLVIVIDMEGRQATANDPKANATMGLRDSDLKPVCSALKSKDESMLIFLAKAFKALHTAYINLLKDPFYQTDKNSLLTSGTFRSRDSEEITSRRFINEVQRIGKAWSVGIGAI